MENYDYLILGAGPAGLTFANLLRKKAPDRRFLVLEKEDTAGGLCRSKEVDGAPLDIAGGHFLDVRRPEVNRFLFEFMPREEWELFDRDSRIDMGTYETGHPFEANIWQLPQEEQVKFLKSIAVAGCNLGTPMPEKFVDWVVWKLGDKVADAYMLPYNGKMFGGELNQLGTYWLEKLPDVSFEETLLSCLNRRPYGTQPGHAQFYYPKQAGYGELWERMGRALGDSILFHKTVTGINPEEKKVTCEDGSVFKADTVITTIPWRSVKEYVDCEQEIVDSIGMLKATGTEIRYVPENLDTKAHWIYVPDPEVPWHRLLVRHNFCAGSRGYWKETNLNRVTEGESEYAFANEYTYPLNTIGKPAVMSRLLRYMRQRGIYGLGRWGEHEHYNSDRTVERAMELFQELVGGRL
ncbi:MAG: FAD-dependent oxidoreductase [Butyrivibrio sp.]|nr:FAD-dependent oxidoreductase [Acetatifactor muris]MCM1558987.1 FAD-dependent oxidoreductase [Butyrivibrio sp.]